MVAQAEEGNQMSCECVCMCLFIVCMLPSQQDRGDLMCTGCGLVGQLRKHPSCWSSRPCGSITRRVHTGLCQACVFGVWRVHFGGLKAHFGGPGGVLEALLAHPGDQEGSGINFYRF